MIELVSGKFNLICDHCEDLEDGFPSKRPFKKFLMTIEEEAVFNELPGTVTAYRAPGSTVGDPGISWTLDKEFADRYAKSMNRAVIEREMPKSRIVAYFSRRGEQEVIIL